MTLDLARLVGDEHNFIQLDRQARKEPGTALAQVVLAVKKRAEAARLPDAPLVEALGQTASALAREDLAQGLALLAQFLHRMPVDAFDVAPRQILAECAAQLEQHGARRLEYVILALHTLTAGWPH
jgi:hypothetical protein